MSEQLHANKIGALQLAALLILSRLFILLIYVPNTHNAVVGTPALLGILLGGVLTCVALLPAYLLFRQCPGMDLQQIARQFSPGLGKVTAALFYLSCMVVAAETAAQAARTAGMLAMASAGTSREVVLAVNGIEFGRAIMPDWRAVEDQSPRIVSDRG